jgi:hypothetical protein
VPFERPLTEEDVAVRPFWSTTTGEKVELVETCRWYEVAPEEAFQLSVGATD